MSEPLTFKVKLVFDERSLEEIRRKLESTINRAFTSARKEGAGKEARGERLTGVLDSVSRGLGNLGRFITRPIENVFSKISTMAIKIGERIKELVGIGEKGTATEGVGEKGLGLALGMGAIAAAIMGLFGSAKKIFGILEQSSSLLRMIMKMFRDTFMMLIRPFADLIGFMLKPIAIFFLRYIAVPFYKELLPLIKGFSKIWESVLMPIFKTAAPVIVQALKYLAIPLLVMIANLIGIIVAPIIFIASIIAALRIIGEWIYNNLSGFFEWVTEGLAGVGAKISEGINWILGLIGDFFRDPVGTMRKVVEWLVEKIREMIDRVISFIGDFFRDPVGTIANAIGSVIGKIFGFGEWQMENFMMGRPVVPPYSMTGREAKIEQRIYIYPKIEIGSVSSEVDLVELERRIDIAIADALRRRGVVFSW